MNNRCVIQQLRYKWFTVMHGGEVAVDATVVAVGLHSPTEGSRGKPNVHLVAMLACTDRTFECIDDIGGVLQRLPLRGTLSHD